MSSATKHCSLCKDTPFTYRFNEKRLRLLVHRSQPAVLQTVQIQNADHQLHSLFSFPLLKLCWISYHHILSLTSIRSRQCNLLTFLMASREDEAAETQSNTEPDPP